MLKAGADDDGVDEAVWRGELVFVVFDVPDEEKTALAAATTKKLGLRNF